MILAAVLLGIIVLFLALFIVFLNLILLPAIKKESEQIDDPLLAYSEKNYIEPQCKDLEITDNRAFVMCSCNKNFKNKQSVYNEKYTCFMVKSLQDSPNDCKFSCIGLGDCTKVCPQQAISIINNTAVISNMCCGCGKCINICPQQIIKLIPKDTKSLKYCMNSDIKNLTSCDAKNHEIKIEWNEKKDFKIWTSCYKLIKRFIKK